MVYTGEQNALKVHEFIELLNHEGKAGARVIVEGKKDELALREVGFKGEILVYNNFKGIINFVDHVSKKRRKVILLLDRDRNGKSLTSKILKKLDVSCPHDGLYYKRGL